MSEQPPVQPPQPAPPHWVPEAPAVAASLAPAQAAEAPTPLSARRKVLLGVAGALLVAIVVAFFALSAVVGSLADGPSAPGAVDAGGTPLSNCGESFPDGFSDAARDELTTWYGEDFGDSLRPTGVPEGFPAAPFSRSGIVPLCGSSAIGNDGEVFYVFYAEDVSRARFDGLASMLTAAGNIMTADAVPREPQGLEPGEFSGADATDLDELYREFVVPDRGVIWLTFETDDLLSTSGTGELIIEYSPRS